MDKLVLFIIPEGNFEQGCPVTLQIWENGKIVFTSLGRLPPAPEIFQLYAQWNSVYLNFVKGRHLGLEIPQEQVTNFSVNECNGAAKDLENSLNSWLGQEQFRQLREGLIQRVQYDETVHFIVQTEDMQLRRLPWHLCELFRRYTKAEIVLSTPKFDRQEQSRASTDKLRILAILGNSDEIDVRADLAIIQQLPGVEVIWLSKPTRQEIAERLTANKWDILFFAGHGGSGHIQINDSDTITVENLQNTLRRAVENGLKLAIFNCCDGLGLARDLEKLCIPQVIVMREIVPDKIAHKFLQYFLEGFSQGDSFYLAVQKARDVLNAMENNYPCASWLPVICQNPASAPLTWPTKKENPRWRFIFSFASSRTGFVSLAVITALLIVIIYLISQRQHQQELADRISSGEIILFKPKPNQEAGLEDKKSGVKEFANKKYKEAIDNFQESLKKYPNDPETLIYLNNARIGNKNAFKIGVSVPIGSNPNIAQELLRGVAQLQNEVNRNSGINGVLLKVEIANDDNNPTIAQQVATEFVKDPGILAVIGHNATNASIATAPLYQQGSLVAISPTSSADNLSNLGSYIFRTGSRNKFLAETLAGYAIQTVHKTNIAICIDSRSIDNASLKQDLTKAIEDAGGKVTPTDCDLSPSNFNPKIVDQAIKDGADSLVLAPYVDGIDQAVKAAQANHGRLALFGSLSLYTIQTLEKGQADVSGMVIVAPWHPRAFPNTHFLIESQQLWHGPVSWRTATAYDGAQAIIKALQLGNTSRDRIQKALSTPGFSLQGATGTIQFDRSGDRNNIASIVQVQKVSQSATGYDFVFLKSIEGASLK